MTAQAHLVLDHRQITQKIRRIAYEIFEDHFEEQSLCLAGIDGQGYLLAQLIRDELQRICDRELTLMRVSINKETPTQTHIETDLPIEQVNGQAIILVDDVLYTGRTLAYSLKPFLKQRIKSLRVAVLVNRSHTVFPIQPRYTGYELATTLADHIEVRLNQENSRVSMR